jgi:hypothetical protein
MRFEREEPEPYSFAREDDEWHVLLVVGLRGVGVVDA